MLPDHPATAVSDGNRMELAIITLNTKKDSRKQTRSRYDCTNNMEATQLRRKYTMSPSCISFLTTATKEDKVGLTPPASWLVYLPNI